MDFPPDNQPQHKLKKVHFLVTGCNLACPMCSMNLNSETMPELLKAYQSPSKAASLTLDECRNFFAEVAPQKPLISIGGGEPFLMPYMMDLIEYLKKDLRLSVGVTSNTTRFDKETMDRFAASGATITVSVDGLEEVHDAIRGKGNFIKTISSLRYLSELNKAGKFKGLLSALFVIHDVNLTEMMPVADLVAGEIGVPSLTMSNMLFSTHQTLVDHQTWVSKNQLSGEFAIHNRRGGDVTMARLKKFDFDRIWQSILEIKAKYPKTVRFEPDFLTHADMKKYYLTNEVMPDYFSGRCYPIHNDLTLLSSGDVMFLPGCFELNCGNIRNKSFNEIWHNETLDRLRTTLNQELSPICSHCCTNRVQKHLA